MNKTAKYVEAGIKYELTDNKMNYQGHTVYQVQYKDGKLGGWIESEKNLQGNAKVLDESIIYGKAVVKDSAVVRGKSYVSENALVSGHAKIQNSTIQGGAKVTDYAKVVNCNLEGFATVSKFAKVSGYHLGNNVCISGEATLISTKNHSITDKNVEIIGGTIKNSNIEEKSRIEFGKIENSEIYDTIVKNGTIKDSIVENSEVIKGTISNNSYVFGLLINGGTIIHTHLDNCDERIEMYGDIISKNQVWKDDQLIKQ